MLLLRPARAASRVLVVAAAVLALALCIAVPAGAKPDQFSEPGFAPAAGGVAFPAFWSNPATGDIAGIQIRNDGPSAGDVELWYLGAGGEAPRLVRVEPALPPGAGFTYLPPADLGELRGALYARPSKPGVTLQGVANLVVSDPAGRRLASSGGIGQLTGPTSSYLPRLRPGDGSSITLLPVATGVPVPATVVYRALDGRVLHQAKVTLEPFRPAQLPLAPSALPQVAGESVFSAQVTAPGPVAVTAVRQEGQDLLAYNAVAAPPAGEASIDVPLVLANDSGTSTTLHVQSTAAAAQDVTIDYGPNQAETPVSGLAACPFGPTTTRQLPAGGGVALESGEQFAACAYVGSARVTAPAGAVVVVDQEGPAGASAYEAGPSDAAERVVLPLVQSNDRTVGWVQVANRTGKLLRVSGGPGQNSDGGAGACAVGPAEALKLGGWGTESVDFPAAVTGFSGCRFVGDFIARATGGSVAAVANQVVKEPGYADGLSSYIGFPAAS